MSFSLGRTVIGIRTLKTLTQGLRTASSLGTAGRLVPSTCLRAGAPRGFTRSIWYLASRTQGDGIARKHSKHCKCCSLHTEADREMSEFLDDEIKLEKEAEKTTKQIVSFKGFEVSSDGADVTMKRSKDGEILTLKWNVNNTVDDEFPPEFDDTKQDESESAMVSKPTFMVFLNKGGDKTLALQCHFPSEDLVESQEPQNEEIVDALEISEVALVQGTDWDDKDYAVMASVMDGNLYTLLLAMLEDRGINAEFMDELLEFSTTFEHKQYIGFLEKLREFAKK